MDISPALCVVVLCSGFNRSPSTDYTCTFLVTFATLWTQISGRCLYLVTTGSSQISSNPSFNIILTFDTSELILSYCQRRHIQHIAHETAVCRNPHNSSKWDSRITRQLGYKHTFCQNVVPTIKKCLPINFRKNITYLNVGQLMGGQIISAFCKIVYRWVRINCCFMSNKQTNKWRRRMIVQWVEM